MVFLADRLRREADRGWQPLVLMGSELPFPFELAPQDAEAWSRPGYRKAQYDKAVEAVAGYLAQARVKPRALGLTTEVAALTVYLLGGACLAGHVEIALALQLHEGSGDLQLAAMLAGFMLGFGLIGGLEVLPGKIVEMPYYGTAEGWAQFLSEMDRVVPWSRLTALIEPHYPKPGKGRRPIALETMLPIHFMQQWFVYSDPAMEEALHDIPVLRRFAGLYAAVFAQRSVRVQNLLEKRLSARCRLYGV